MSIASFGFVSRHLRLDLCIAGSENSTPTVVLHVIQCPAIFMQATTRKTRILDVVYNASNNELVSTSSAELPMLQHDS